MADHKFLSTIANEFPPDFITTQTDELQIYGKDWTKVFTPNPSAVVFPRTTEEVCRFLKVCTQFKVSVVPSGGRTGLAGGAVASQNEVVLSLNRMNRIGPVNLLAQTVQVQAGAVTEAVHRHCESEGLIWPIDFASKGSSQVGGNIATNAGGVKVIRYGLTRNWVLGLEVVTMQGDSLKLNGSLEKNNTGMDLRQLFIGTEGTLGVITEATLKLTRKPGELKVFFFAVQGIPEVLQLFQHVRKSPFQVMAFEFLTQNCLKLVTEIRGIKNPFQNQYPAYVLLEVEKPEDLDSWLEGLFHTGLVQDGVLAQSSQEAQNLWTLREGISESLSHRGFTYKNDIALPISSLEKFIPEMFSIFNQRSSDLEVFLFGHIGDGNLHVNTMKPVSLEKDKFIEICHHADQDLFALVKKYEGSVSAEHGIGLLKKDALKFSRSETEIEIMRGFKKVLDPLNLLNPGKIF